MTGGERAAAAALACVGVPFRPHGRDPAFGLDCVGLAGIALRAAGYRGVVPQGYRLATGSIDRVDIPAGLTACDGQSTGDVLLCRVSPTQLHLAVRTDHGIVHADGASRRVLARPGLPPWPILSAFKGDW